VEFVGHIGGYNNTVAVQGYYAYNGEGPALTILDVSNPSSPTVTGKTDPLPDAVVRGVAVVDNYAYVAGGYGGLRVVDISDPFNPIEVGSCDTPGRALSVAIAGDYAYVADGETGLRVMDISTRCSPIEVGFFDTSGQARSVAVAEGYAYVADFREGLRVVDISEPTSPTEVGACDTTAWAVDVTVIGSYGYVATAGGLSVVDVATPDHPTQVGFCDTFRGTGGVAVSGSYAYVTESLTGLRVVDVSVPSEPTEVGFCDMSGSPTDVAVAGGYAFVSGGAGLRVTDVSTPDHPTEVGSYETPRCPRGISVTGGHAYLADYGLGLAVLDVSTPTDPVAVGFLYALWTSESIAVAGDYSFLADGDAGVQVVNVSTPSNPMWLGACDTPGHAQGVGAAGNYAYVADYGEGLRVVDISGIPTEVGACDTPGYAWDVAVSGSYAYVADYDGGLRVVDVSVSTSPTEVGACDALGLAKDVVIAEDYAYVAVGSRGLRVVDITTPSNPTEVGQCDTPGHALGVAVAGNYAYVADAWEGLRVVDVSMPSDPTEVGFYETAEDAWDVVTSDGYAYVADSGGGLFILRYTGAEPTYSLSGHAQDSDGDPVRDVIVSAGAGGSATSGADGSYTVTGLNGGTYTLIPSKSGYTFSPASRAVTVPPDASGLDFIARPIQGAGLSIEHLEVTQAIQDETNDVTLVAGKPTFVRVYVDCGEGCESQEDVSGILRGYDSGGELDGSPLTPANLSVTAHHPSDWTAQRGDLEKTLNFTPPQDWTSGTITLTAEVAGVQYPEPVTFRDVGPIRVVYVPIRYQGTLPDMERIRAGAAFANQVYATSGIIYYAGGELPWERSVAYRPCLPFRHKGSRDRLLNELTTRARQLHADFAFGWLPEGSFGGGISDPTWHDGGAGKAAFADAHHSEWQRYFAHEIGHLMDQHHTNTVDNLKRDEDCPKNECLWCVSDTCRAYVDDESLWPYDDATIQEFGLDGYDFGWLVSSPNAVKDPSDTYDYMSYCGRIISNTVWTSPWIYGRIYSETLKLQTTAKAPQSLSASQSYFIASGLVYTDDTAVLDPIWVVTSTVTPDNPAEGTEYCLEAQDISATPPVTRCFDLSFSDYDTGAETNVDGFNLMLPYPSGVASIALKKGSQELVTRTVSANAPAVTVLSPNGGETWSATDTYTITWTASDADGDSLTYRVLYSPDGSEWVPVGSAITETQLAVNAAELAGGTGAEVRVLASDGINTSSDESDAPFTVESKAPQPFILSPEGDGAITFGAPLHLYGYAYDLEDGTLDGSALNWTSSRDGDLGTGSQLLVTLSSGQHVIGLAATDSSSSTVTSTVQITVNVPPALVPITGATTGRVGSTHGFSVSVDPIEATLPITYVWQATEQPSVTHASKLTITDSIEFTWTTPGAHVVTGTVSNAGGQVTSGHAITICGTADVVCDCVIDIADIQVVAGHWHCEPGGCYEPKFDINSDGRIDVVDIMLVAARWGCKCGDACYGEGVSAQAGALPGQSTARTAVVRMELDTPTDHRYLAAARRP
jgi:hypothetical protein